MHAINISGTQFNTDLSTTAVKEARVAISHAEQQANLELKALSQLVGIKAPEEAREKVSALLSAPYMLLASAVAAAKRRPVVRRPKFEDLFEIAVVNPEAKIGEPVRITGRKKPSGGYRPLCNFGMKHRTCQEAVKRVLAPYYVPRAFQYTMHGVPPAIEAVRAAFADGYVFARKLDIKEFYASFVPANLANELPLPKGVVDYDVSGRHMTGVHGMLGKLPHHVVTHLLTAARQGVSAGSICSPIVAALTVAQLPALGLEDVRLVNYADDFLLLAKDWATLDQRAMELVGAVEALPAGNFNLVPKGIGGPEEGIDFLGHHIALVDGSVSVRVSNASAEKFNFFLADIDIALSLAYEVHFASLDSILSKSAMKPKPLLKEAAVDHLCQYRGYLRSWVGAFKMCDDVEAFRTMASSKLAEHMDGLGITSHDLDQAEAKAGVVHHVDEYDLG